MLDFDSSPQVFKKALLTGHVPGFVEIPKFDRMWEYKAGQIPQDNLIYQISKSYPDKKTVALGKQFSDKGIEELFDISKTTNKGYIAQKYVKDYTEYLNETEYSFLMLHTTLRRSPSLSVLKQSLEEVNALLTGIINEMGENTLLCVTGNKGAKFREYYEYDPIERLLIESKLNLTHREAEVDPQTYESERADEELDRLESEMDEAKWPLTGLFFHTKANSKAKVQITAGNQAEVNFEVADPVT